MYIYNIHYKSVNIYLQHQHYSAKVNYYDAASIYALKDLSEWSPFLCKDFSWVTEGSLYF